MPSGLIFVILFKHMNKEKRSRILFIRLYILDRADLVNSVCQLCGFFGFPALSRRAEHQIPSCKFALQPEISASYSEFRRFGKL